MTTTSAIILAAGYGSRLAGEHSHKLLATVGSRTMLAHHIDNFQRLGVETVVIVAGYRSNLLKSRIQEFDCPQNLELITVTNPDFDGGNGISVLAGADALFDKDQPEPFWLTMSDHLFDPTLFDDLRRRFHTERSPEWQGALLVDQKLDTIFDMPDATKVRRRPADFAIGKELQDFDCVDAGLFWCDVPFIEALRAERDRRGDCSTSDAVRRLHREGHFGFWDIKEFLWQDVDTPGAREHAEALLRDQFQSPPPAPPHG